MSLLLFMPLSNPLYDAHRHVGEKLDSACVVNGTQPNDWLAILDAAKQHAQIIPAIGLHPWRVNDAASDWQARFTQALESGAKAVGEIGLDRWIDDFDIERQEAAFSWQLEQAATHNLPVSIHCLKATAPLLRILKAQARPKRGVHLHAYSGSADQVTQFAELGAYFSFHAGQLNEKTKKAPAAVQVVPAGRLLIETDAPDTLKNSDHPTAFLQRGYEQVAELRGVSLEALAKQLAINFTRYFLDD